MASCYKPEYVEEKNFVLEDYTIDEELCNLQKKFRTSIIANIQQKDKSKTFE